MPINYEGKRFSVTQAKDKPFATVKDNDAQIHVASAIEDDAHMIAMCLNHMLEKQWDSWVEIRREAYK